MISERDFVLNNFLNPYYDGKEDIDTVNALKSIYKTICENTSEESGIIKINKKDFEKLYKAHNECNNADFRELNSEIRLFFKKYLNSNNGLKESGGL